MTTPAEYDALAQVVDAVLRAVTWPLVDEPGVEDVIRALRRLVADPGTRPAVLVALGLGGES